MFRRKHKKNITLSVSINKELDNGKSIKYKIKFVDSFIGLCQKIIIKSC